MTNNKNVQEIDLRLLLNNLRDLDQISKKLIIDMGDKNEILEEGLNNCKIYKIKIDNNKKQQQMKYKN